jgi:hypothetical protein
VTHPKTRVAVDKIRTNAGMTHRPAATILRAPADCVVSRAKLTDPYIGAAVCAQGSIGTLGSSILPFFRYTIAQGGLLTPWRNVSMDYARFASVLNL